VELHLKVILQRTSKVSYERQRIGSAALFAHLPSWTVSSTNQYIKMKPYYYVCRVNYGRISIKHATLEGAEKESLRLAGQHPRETFELLKCMGVTQTTAPKTFWMDGVVPPHVCAMNRIMDDTCHVCGKSSANVQKHPIR
jgi:hypothetical protein